MAFSKGKCDLQYLVALSISPGKLAENSLGADYMKMFNSG